MEGTLAYKKEKKKWNGILRLKIFHCKMQDVSVKIANFSVSSDPKLHIAVK